MSDKQAIKPDVAAAGEGIRSIKTTNVFRLLNFELYTKPVSIGYIKKKITLNQYHSRTW